MKEPIPHKDKPVRKTRSDKGHPQLTSRDEDVLRLIGEQTAYRFDQLQGLLARHPESQSQDPDVLSESRTREIIERWKILGLATYQKIHYDTPGWISLTRKGLYHCNLSLRFIDPRHSDLEHLFWINETRIMIEETYGSCPGFQWESERQYHVTRDRLKAQQRQDPDLWLPHEYRGNHLPDALLQYHLKDEPETPTITSAIEVELSEKSYATWKKIFLELIRFFTNAHYYVDPSIKSMFTKALNKFQNEDPAFDEPNKEQRQYIYIHDLEQRL
ncbi:hypothetical protein [Dictyobacter arantiisoli]|uniref:Uncharacterized protein n=1 Tax=Dictyobacter arantiisoli TaxID=2014874 RepID=A0A5A5TL69_9CHLR|nr:hypothetical protein [Dictyobacter arantiisoli]GCF11813.1 hypothetical protein KDI_53770 [Dictyobacter arantiisoli]